MMQTKNNNSVLRRKETIDCSHIENR